MHHTSYRKEKLPELLKRLAAEFIEREYNRSSLITVTGANISANQQNVDILYTVLPTEEEQNAKKFLDVNNSDFLQFVDAHARIGRMPKISFQLDIGEKNRQRIDEISKVSTQPEQI